MNLKKICNWGMGASVLASLPFALVGYIPIAGIFWLVALVFALTVVFDEIMSDKFHI